MATAPPYLPVPSATEVDPAADLANDPRWQLIERIATSEPFLKSSRLPALLRYLGRYAITENRPHLTEQAIGKAVFGKPTDYTPTEDSSVRVCVRQLRLRLHEYHQSTNPHERIILALPKGGYTLTFTEVQADVLTDPAVLPVPSAKVEVSSAAPTQVSSVQTPLFWRVTTFALLAASLVSAFGWYWTATSAKRSKLPWPLDQVITGRRSTTVVLADAGYALRMLGTEPVPLDRYIDRSFLEPIIPKEMPAGEARLIRYLRFSRLTSTTDAEATATLAALAGPRWQDLVIRSARDLNANDLTHGDFIFVGAKSSNPWVAVFDSRLNFQFMEDASGRFIQNKKPQGSEAQLYRVPDHTGESGQDYATIALLPARNGDGHYLLIQGVRREGTEAAITLLRNPDWRSRLEQNLRSINGGRTPSSFEVLLSAQSVAGSPVSFDVVAARVNL